MALTSAACRRTLDDLSICDRLRDPRFTWIINCAKRKLPTVPFTLPATNAQVRHRNWSSTFFLKLDIQALEIQFSCIFFVVQFTTSFKSGVDEEKRKVRGATKRASFFVLHFPCTLFNLSLVFSRFLFSVDYSLFHYLLSLNNNVILQSSDAEMLKQAFTYARQQAWGSPNVLQLVDRCNKAGVVENWCMVWF